MKTIHIALLVILLTIAGAAGAETILLAENFDDGVADDFTPLSGEWAVVNGEYVCEVTGYEIFAFSAAGGMNWIDYQLDLEIRVLGSINHVVRFRCAPNGDCYELNFRAMPYNDAYFHKILNGEKLYLTSTDIGMTGAGDWHRIMVQALGNRLVVFFNGEAVFDHIDVYNPLFAGGIELCSFSGGVVQWQIAHFDDILVTALTTPATATSWGRIKQLY